MGTQVAGSAGAVGSPLEEHLQLFFLSAGAFSGKRKAERLFRRCLALFAHPLMHRRDLVAVFGEAQVLLGSFQPGIKARILVRVVDEMAIATVLLPFAETSLRWPVCDRISMTDTTPGRAGAVHARVSQPLVRSLWHICESRWASVRLGARILDMS